MNQLTQNQQELSPVKLFTFLIGGNSNLSSCDKFHFVSVKATNEQEAREKTGLINLVFVSRKRINTLSNIDIHFQESDSLISRKEYAHKLLKLCLKHANEKQLSEVVLSLDNMLNKISCNPNKHNLKYAKSELFAKHFLKVGGNSHV